MLNSLILPPKKFSGENFLFQKPLDKNKIIWYNINTKSKKQKRKLKYKNEIQKSFYKIQKQKWKYKIQNKIPKSLNKQGKSW